MTDERKVERAMKKGLVDVVERILGDPPQDVYGYGMQFEWKKRAYQWIADQRRPESIYPTHCWSAGYAGPQEPLTWFACRNCGRTQLGSPHAEPSHQCFMCTGHGEFVGWEVADMGAALTGTIQAMEGMSADSQEKVLKGP